MSRRTSAERRVTEPDPRFESTTVTKFINNLMLDGKKSIAESIFYEALEIAEEKSGQPGLNVFRQALTNAKPAQTGVYFCRLEAGSFTQTRKLLIAQ